MLEETLRPDAAETIAFMREQEVDLKLISGDARATVTAVAYAVGVPREAGVIEGPELPEDPEALAAAAQRNTIFCRIKPEQKKALVAALSDVGALHGDDRRRRQRRAGAEAGADGGGDGLGRPGDQGRRRRRPAQRMSSRGCPEAIGEGRRIARNIHRLGRLYLTKTVYAAALILFVAVPGFAFPFLPRHLTLAGLSDDRHPLLRARPRPLGRAALPGPPDPRPGRLRGAGRGWRRRSARSSPSSSSTPSSAGRLEAGRTAATTTLIVLGLSFVLLLERGPGREHIAIQSYMLALVAGLGALFALGLAAAPVRDFFQMALLSATQWFLALLSAAIGLTIASLLWRLPQIERLEAPAGPLEPREDRASRSLRRLYISKCARFPTLAMPEREPAGASLFFMVASCPDARPRPTQYPITRFGRACFDEAIGADRCPREPYEEVIPALEGHDLGELSNRVRDSRPTRLASPSARAGRSRSTRSRG